MPGHGDKAYPGSAALLGCLFGPLAALLALVLGVLALAGGTILLGSVPLVAITAFLVASLILLWSPRGESSGIRRRNPAIFVAHWLIAIMTGMIGVALLVFVLTLLGPFLIGP